MTKSQNEAAVTQENLTRELAFREKLGMIRVTVGGLTAMIKELGYRFDDDMACKSMARYMTGERAGQSYPSNQLYPVQIDDGKSFAHVNARRDANFEALKKVRDTHYAVHAGYIYEF